jgi:2'-5' RNA ligase superfamily protein
VTDDHMADHWWWRPGWRPGRRMYTWHFTFEGQPAVHDLAAAYQARLDGLPDLDMIPARWLHLTTQGVGFTDEVTDDQVAAIITYSRERLFGFTPQHVTLGPAKVTPEAILFDVAPVAPLAAIRRELRGAIADVLGTRRLMESDEWTPHVSVAYSNGTGPAAPYVAALEDGGTAQTVISDVELIVLGRDQHLYEWTTRGDIRLAGDTADMPGGALR